MNEFAGDNFKFDVKGRKLSKRVENTMGKGEIARYDCPQCFQKACFPGASKGVTVWEWVKSLWQPLHPLPNNYHFYCICSHFTLIYNFFYLVKS